MTVKTFFLNEQMIEADKHDRKADLKAFGARIQNLRSEIQEVIQIAKTFIPKNLACLEWSHLEYHTYFDCSSVHELKYHAGEPYEITNEPFETKIHVDAERLGKFKTEAYELVVCTNVFEHLSHPETSFRSIVQAMAPSAWLLITAPFLEIIHGSPWDFHRYTYHAWYVYAKDNGLCIHKIGGVGEIEPGELYLLSYAIAQKPPCNQSHEVFDTPGLGLLANENGYVL